MPSGKSFGGRLKQAFLGGKKTHHEEGLDPSVFEEAEFQRSLEKVSSHAPLR